MNKRWLTIVLVLAAILVLIFVFQPRQVPEDGKVNLGSPLQEQGQIDQP